MIACVCFSRVRCMVSHQFRNLHTHCVCLLLWSCIYTYIHRHVHMCVYTHRAHVCTCKHMCVCTCECTGTGWHSTCTCRCTPEQSKEREREVAILAQGRMCFKTRARESERASNPQTSTQRRTQTRNQQRPTTTAPQHQTAEGHLARRAQARAESHHCRKPGPTKQAQRHRGAAPAATPDTVTRWARKRKCST